MRPGIHTPWSDEADLIVYDLTQNERGYPAAPSAGGTELSRRTVTCQFEDGTSQGEFYASMKAGLRASASVELWAADYDGEEYVEFAGALVGRRARLYKVLRSFPSSFDHVTLILEEVVRT